MTGGPKQTRVAQTNNNTHRTFFSLRYNKVMERFARLTAKDRNIETSVCPKLPKGHLFCEKATTSGTTVTFKEVKLVQRLHEFAHA